MATIKFHWIKRFVTLAAHISTWSKDPSTQCGAVIIRPNYTICSVGFNGFPRKMSDDSRLYDNKEYKHSAVIHAEMNALMVAPEPVKGYWLFMFPIMPCDRCAVHLIQAGITRVMAPKAESTPNMGDLPYRMARKHFADAGVKLDEFDGSSVL